MRTLIALLSATLLAPPPQPAAVGAVAGTVSIAVAAPEQPPQLGRYARRRAVPPPATARSGGVGDVVVYLLADGPLPSPAPSSPPRVVQRARTVEPFVTVAHVGQRVEFPNDDDVFHNLFSLSEPNRFDLGRYPPGEAKSHAFRHAGAVRLFCDIHSEMAAVILVLDSPYWTRPDAAGRFRIEGVPAGRYRAVAWHDRAGADTVAITVEAGGTAAATFALGS